MDMGELKRAFRDRLAEAFGELEMDEEMFNRLTPTATAIVMEEFDANVPAAVRAKIIEKRAAGSSTRRCGPRRRAATQDELAKIFKKFDVDNDGFLDFRELQRAFRAIGLKKRRSQLRA